MDRFIGKVNVVLFSQDSSVISFADEFGSRVSVEPNIEFHVTISKVYIGLFIVIGDLPLHCGVLPPFVYGKGLHNHWVLTEACPPTSGLCLMQDWTISNFYLNDLDHENHQLIEGIKFLILNREVGNFWAIAISEGFTGSYLGDLTRFYYAHLDGITIAALEKVARHAVNANLLEQPSFYDTLCGEGVFHRIGNNRCLENSTVYFLNRDLFL
ncbi:unnamed protein product [Fraxinus pennsylvanica]|uniref:Uncharacterized protein n=1 Tax=Fraxinus pennsylvanica TaxID=56036 RepID=A0AAD1Z586_9LAMI|nr:unnamed protein product [Fraxinus pennsylvanica]